MTRMALMAVTRFRFQPNPTRDRRRMMIKAFYTDRRGAGCVRTINSAEEAEKILKGGYGATEVRLENEDGEVVGERTKAHALTLRGNGKYFWWFWNDLFDAAGEQP